MPEQPYPYMAIRAARAVLAAAEPLLRREEISSRSPLGDALLDLKEILDRRGQPIAIEWPADFLPSEMDIVHRMVQLQPEVGPAVRAMFDELDRTLIFPAESEARLKLGAAVGATLGRFSRLCAHARMVAEGSLRG